MPNLTVTLSTIPTTKDARLIYLHDYTGFRHELDYLQIVRDGNLFRSGRYDLEDLYYSNLDVNRKMLLGMLDAFEFDLIIDPPSRNTLHRPYLASVLTHPRWNKKRPLRFEKTQNVGSDDLNVLRGAVDMPPDWKSALAMSMAKQKILRILIVDDVFARGNVATVVTEQLIGAGLSPSIEITIACPLRIPPERQKKGTDEFTVDDLPQIEATIDEPSE